MTHIFCRTCGGVEKRDHKAQVCIKEQHDYTDLTERVNTMIKKGYLRE